MGEAARVGARDRFEWTVLDHLERLEAKVASLSDAPSNVTELWLTKKELAPQIPCSVRFLEMRMKDGMPHREVAGKVVFSKPAVESWLRANGHLRETKR